MQQCTYNCYKSRYTNDTLSFHFQKQEKGDRREEHETHTHTHINKSNQLNFFIAAVVILPPPPSVSLFETELKELFIHLSTE